MKRRFTSGWAVVLILGLLAGCGDGRNAFEAAAESTATSSLPATSTTTSPATTAAPTTTTLPATTTTAAPTTTVGTTTTTSTAPSTTTTSTTTTTTLPPFPCPLPGAGPIPTGVTDVSTIGGDFDGDGIPDDLTAYRDGGTWYLQARLGPGYTTRLALDAGFEAGPLGGLSAGPVFVENALTLGHAAQFALVMVHGGLVAVYGLFAVESCALVPVTELSGEFPDLWVGGSPVHIDRPICGPDNQVHMAVFGATAGCDINSCTDVNFQQSSYQVWRSPARIELVTDGATVVPAATMADVLARNCLDY